MLKKSTHINPFNTKYFMWIDASISSQKWINNDILNNCLKCLKNNFSICNMFYYNKNYIKNYAQFYEIGRYGMAGGILSGNIESIINMYILVKNKFLELINLGYGHAEEQIFIELEKEYPNLFDLYYGTYNSVLINYIDIVKDVDKILDNIVSNSRLDNNHNFSYNVCDKIQNSLNKKIIILSPSELLKYIDEFFICSWYLKKYDECVSIIKYLENEMKTANNKNEIIDEFKKNIDHYTSNFDFILPYILCEKQIAVYNNNIINNDNNTKIFIYISEEIDGHYLLTSNPVKRPPNKKININYDKIYD